MISLEERLCRAGRVLDNALDDPSTALAGSPLRATTVDGSAVHRRRPVLALMTVASIVAVTVTFVVVRSTPAHDKVTPASADPTDEPAPSTATASTQASAPVSTAANATPPTTGSSTPPASADPNAPLPDLSIGSGGLYIDPASLPAGWLVTRAVSTQQPLGGTGAQYEVSETRLAKYSSDRSRIDAGVDIRVMNEGSTEHMKLWYGPLTPTDITIAGNAVYSSQYGLIWLDADRVVAVVQIPEEVDLASIARGLKARADGGYDATVLPDGYEQVAVVPGTQSGTGTSWSTGYKVDTEGDADQTILNVQIDPHPATSAEADFAEAGRSPYDDVHAVSIGGRRMIVYPRVFQSANVVFDLSNGDRVTVSYRPTDHESLDERATAAVAIAAALRRADDVGWSDITDQARANTSEFDARAWIEAPMAARGLTPTGPTAGIATLDQSTVIATVPAIDADGGVATCEFLHRELITCTAASAPAQQSATAVDEHLLRVTAAIGLQVHIDVTGSQLASAGTALNPMFPGINDLKVAYFLLPDGVDTVTNGCVTLLGVNDAVLGTIPIDGFATAPCPTPEPQPTTTNSVPVTNSSVPATNSSVHATNSSVPEG